MTSAKAILVAAALISATHLYVSRWQISSSSNLTFRLDRWTGQVTMCNEKNDAILAALNAGQALALNCTPN